MFALQRCFHNAPIASFPPSQHYSKTMYRHVHCVCVCVTPKIIQRMLILRGSTGLCSYVISETISPMFECLGREHTDSQLPVPCPLHTDVQLLLGATAFCLSSRNFEDESAPPLHNAAKPVRVRKHRNEQTNCRR